MLGAGTRWIWVARLVGPRRVEVYKAGRPMRTAIVGDELSAPGVLRNPVPVAALFDRAVAHEVTLRNLLQRKGFDDLDAVRAAGRDEGRDEGRQEGRQEGERAALVEAIEALAVALDLPLTPARRAELGGLDAGGLRARLIGLRDLRRWEP